MELYIHRYGAKVAVKDGVFEVTYFDEHSALQKETYTPLQVKSIWVQDGCTVTVAAHLLANQHGIDLVLLDAYGMPQARVQGFERASTPAVEKAQAILSVSGEAVLFIRQWLETRMRQQAEFLEKLRSRREAPKQDLLTAKALEIRKLRQQILGIEAQNMEAAAEQFRGLEGAASQVYFGTLSAVLPEEYRFDGRSRQPARDPFNAFLNYAMAILYGKVEKALRLAGISPFIGFLHRDDYQHKSMLFDFIEPYRIWAERLVFRLFSRKMVASTHTVAHHGGLHLNALGKKLLGENLKEYLEEKKEELDNILLSREQYLRQSALRFAARMVHLAQGSGIEAVILPVQHRKMAGNWWKRHFRGGSRPELS